MRKSGKWEGGKREKNGVVPKNLSNFFIRKKSFYFHSSIFQMKKNRKKLESSNFFLLAQLRNFDNQKMKENFIKES